METNQQRPTVIEVKKRFENLVIGYLQQNSMNYKVVGSDNPRKTRIQIENLESTDAFRLGVQTQVQLVDGEYLI